MGLIIFKYRVQINEINFENDTVHTEEYMFDSLNQISSYMKSADLTYATSINIIRETEIIGE